MRTYKVVILGAAGAGKTVFLASLFHRLAIQDEAIGFFLESEWDQRTLLTKWYNQIADTAMEWPRPTQAKDTRIFEFICTVKKQDTNGDYDNYQALRFTYLDYPGGFLTDESGGEALDRLKRSVFEADSLLGIIDGHKVFAAITNKPSPGGTSIYHDIDNILSVLQYSRNPVHLILTKWDILRNNGVALKQARDWLMLYQPFARFVRGRDRQKYPMRLIPVSAVGYEFSKLNSEGSVSKIVGHRPDPVNVEMPLACILLDKFALHLQELLDQKEKEAKKEISNPIRYSVRGRLSKLFGNVIRIAIGFLPTDFQFSEKIFQNLVDWVERDARKDEEISRRELEELVRQKQVALTEVANEITAVEYVTHCFNLLTIQLRSEYPESDLSRL